MNSCGVLRQRGGAPASYALCVASCCRGPHWILWRLRVSRQRLRLDCLLWFGWSGSWALFLLVAMAGLEVVGVAVVRLDVGLAFVMEWVGG